MLNTWVGAATENGGGHQTPERPSERNALLVFAPGFLPNQIVKLEEVLDQAAFEFQ
jgi:hypothetical protein